MASKNPKAVRKGGLFLLGLLFLQACAPLPPIPKRPDFKTLAQSHDSVDALKLYYDWRLRELTHGYAYGSLEIPKGRIAEFMEAQGDTLAANWARKGNWMIGSGWALSIGLEAAAIGVSANAGNDPSKNMWWISAAPLALLGWAYQELGEKWFREPAVTKYNLELKRELKLTRD
jgi:hypothetical protein